LLWSLAALAQSPLTEDQYVTQVLSGSLEARVADADVALAGAQAVGVGTWPNPSVTWERQPNPTEDRVVGGQHVLAASIPLVVSGRLGLEAEAASLGIDAAQARRARARAELRRTASAAFSSVLAATQRRALLAESLKALQQLTAIVEVREKAGASAGYDLTRVNLERAVVEDELRAAALEERRAKATALQLLGPGATELPLFSAARPGPGAILETSVLLASLEPRRADVTALGVEARAAETARRAAGRSWIPEPSITAGGLILEGAKPGSAVGLVVGVTVPLPIFEHGQGPAARAEARRTLLEARRAQVLHAARIELVVAADALKARTERFEKHRTTVVAPSLELRTIATAAYRGGSAEVLVLMDAERTAREAGLRDIGLALEVDLAWADLRFISGIYDTAEAGSSAP
jgi:cobalt-zinc-cadmium efflux system outer membrane protein